MNNQYVFIIWNKALFAKDKIINDLSKSFEIQKQFYIEWSKENFEKNLIALYGKKCDNPKQKAIYIGKGKFLVIIIKDNNPVFERREQQHKLVLVNSNVYDKKWLYRKWTAGNFRIHASVTDEETKHDLSILLGNKCNLLIEKTKANETIMRDVENVDDVMAVNDKVSFLETLKDQMKYYYMRLIKK